MISRFYNLMEDLLTYGFLFFDAFLQGKYSYLIVMPFVLSFVAFLVYEIFRFIRKQVYY